jgi:ApaG protein
MSGHGTFHIMTTRSFYYRETDGIRITVRPMYLPDQSSPARRHFVFAYFVRIENVSAAPAKLLTRRWLIHDSIGEETEVEGDGVVGEQPRLEPSQVHEYQSFCVLRSRAGWMEGHYSFARDDRSIFRAMIPRFELAAAPEPSGLT